MTAAGRAAALPQAGYAQPQRLFVSATEVRVRALPENGKPPHDIDLTALPVARPLQEWLAVAVAEATGPSGPLRSAASQRNVRFVLGRFTRYLASLHRAPQRPEQLRRTHVDGFVLAGGRALHRDLGSLRSLLRHADPPPPDEFWARLTTIAAPKISDRLRSYSEAEFRRNITRCKGDLRQAAARIRRSTPTCWTRRSSRPGTGWPRHRSDSPRSTRPLRPKWAAPSTHAWPLSGQRQLEAGPAWWPR